MTATRAGTARPAAGRRVPTALGLVAVLAAEAGLFAGYLRYPNLHRQHEAVMLAVLALPLWLVAVWLLARLRPSGRQAALWVLGVGAVLQVLAVVHPPTTSDDDYRYTWDARVQLAGIDPYRYAPAAPQLAHLRTPAEFGAPDHCSWAFPGGCTSINRPTVHTVYPPVAEAAFTAIRLLSFGGRGNHLPLQLAAALGALVIGWLLLRRARGRPELAALWMWCPVTVVEYGNNAHIDWLATMFVVLALQSRRSARVAGALVGAAVAVKIYPVLVLPSLLRRSWQAAGAAVAVVAIGYLPHVLAAGRAVIGYLPGYLHEEQYGSGGRLQLLSAVLPHPVETVVGVAIVAAVCVWAWRRGPVDAPQRSAVVVVGTAFAVFTPNYPWYTGLLLALVALSAAYEWLPLVVVATFTYLDHGDRDALYYLIGVVLTGALAVARHPAAVQTLGRSIARAARR